MMDKYKYKFTRLQLSILRFLSIKAGSKINQRTIAKNLKVSPTAIAKALKNLEKTGLIKVKKDSLMNLNLVELNRENKKAIEFKRTENLKMVYESGIVDFLEDNFPGTTIILFGSYCYGEDTNMEQHVSDIDIAIIGTEEKAIDTEKFDKFLEREILINFYRDWKSIDKNLKNNILNGIVLVGRIGL